jgi:energy-converting hydrogenase Eha subunit C
MILYDVVFSVAGIVKFNIHVIINKEPINQIIQLTILDINHG